MEGDGEEGVAERSLTESDDVLKTRISIKMNPACWRAESSTPLCLTRQGWPELKMSRMRRLLLRTIRKLSISDCARWKEQDLNSKKKGTGLCPLQRMVVLYLVYIVCLKLWD